MTPMIDVVFLLLIFFICTASFQITEQDLPSNLRIESGAGTSTVEVDPDLEDLPPVIVSISWNGGRPAWEMNGHRYTSLGAVRQVLAAAAQVDHGLPVILDVEGDVPLGYVIDLYDASRFAGFEKIQFAASVGI